MPWRRSAAPYNAPMVASGAWLFATASLVLLASAAFAAGLWWARARHGSALRDALAEAQALASLHQGVLWRSDDQHCLRPLRQPVATMARAADAAALLPDGRALWDHVRCEDGTPSLQQWLEARQPFGPLRVRGPATAAPPLAASPQEAGWLLRGQPCFDAEGRFDGYLGSLCTAVDAARGPHNGLPPAASADPGSSEAQDEQASFSYTVSHDLRAPIRVVEGFTRILKEDYGPRLDRVGNDHLDRVLGAAARMNQMIDAMLTLARLSTQPLARQPVNLSQLAGYIVDDLARGAPEREVEVEIEPGLIARGDPTLLRLVLENLLGNAWKYTQRTPRARIAVAAEAQPAGRCAFVVRDNGAGFDMRSAERLFGLFQRLHSASEFPGTGVGLASVKRIVQRHGGDIWAEAEPGRGATFHVTLRD
jgi:two-component sensor histidine kinase